MKYLIDDLALAAFIQTLRPDYIHVRAVSEVQQFLGREGVAQFHQPPAKMSFNEQALRDSVAEETHRLDSCTHVWKGQFGHRHKICKYCGSISVEE